MRHRIIRQRPIDAREIPCTESAAIHWMIRKNRAARAIRHRRQPTVNWIISKADIRSRPRPSREVRPSTSLQLPIEERPAAIAAFQK